MNTANRTSKLRRFRAIAFWEGVSYLALLGIAMPLKYLADQPLPVKYLGWAHGILFILYALSLAETMIALRWPLRRGVIYFIASLLPAAPFVVERSLRSDEQALCGADA